MKMFKESLPVILLAIMLVKSVPIEELSHLTWSKPMKISEMFK